MRILTEEQLRRFNPDLFDEAKEDAEYSDAVREITEPFGQTRLPQNPFDDPGAVEPISRVASLQYSD